MTTDQQTKARTEQADDSPSAATAETATPAESDPIERPGEPTPESDSEETEDRSGQASLFDGGFDRESRRERASSNSGDGKLDPFAIPESFNYSTLQFSRQELREAMKRPWEVAADYIDTSAPSPTEGSAVFTGEMPYGDINMILDHIRGVVEESRLAVTEEGWFISVTDPANVGMLYIWLPKSEWKHYEVEQPGSTGVPWTRFEDAISHADTKSQIEITLEDSYNEDVEGGTRSDFIIDDGIPFEFSGIEMDSVRTPAEIPELELPNSVTLPGVDVREVVDRMDDITSHLSVTGMADTNSVELYGEGDTSSIRKKYAEFDDLTVYSGSRKNPVFDTNIVEDAESLFSIEYLKDYFSSPKRKDQKVGYRFQFGQEFPMKCTRDFGEEGFIQFMLAPRIKSS